MKLRIEDVGRLLGLKLPAVGKKGRCPFQKHARDDPTFRVYAAKVTKDELYKCWSCDGDEASGDAVKLYAILSRIERPEAYARLREQGFKLSERPDLPSPRRGTPVGGEQPKEIVPLDLSIVAASQANPYAHELVALFAQKRQLSAEMLLEHGVIGLPRHAEGGAIGFVYTDPSRRIPCRVKVRAISSKKMYCIPKGDSDRGARALGPLYLAERLDPYVVSDWLLRVAIITEGEVDALTLRGCGFPNVVSLPDGARSAMTADLRPLFDFSTWLCAFDDDDAGKKALVELKERARGYGVDLVPLQFGDFKDANDAWRGGMTREELAQCVDRALLGRYGYRVPWRRVA